MRKYLLIAAAALLVGAAPARAPIADFVRAVLPFADDNFAPLRGAKNESGIADTVYARYKLRLDPGVCSDCSIFDVYGRGKSAEYWEVSNFYTEDPSGSDDLVQPSFSSAPAPPVQASPTASASPGAEVPPPGLQFSPPPEWSIQKTENYVKSQLTPLLPGFSLRRTTSYGVGAGANVPTLLWRNPHNVWVEAKMYPQMVLGMLKVHVLVGHDLPKSAHVLLPATKAQIDRMQNATRRFIRTAVPAASTGFSAMRGSVMNKNAAGYEYHVTAPFGPAFRSCEIASRMGQTAGKSSETAWDLVCTTVPTLGKRPSQEELVRSAISDALPSGFTPAADAKARGYDYLWSNSEGVSVAIEWGDPQGEIVSFSVRIMYTSP